MTKYISSAGSDDLKKLLDRGEYYVDKTLAIKELLEGGGDIFLMTRPRRFGKTLMLTMIQRFFEKTENSNDYLFKDKKIWRQVHPALGPYKDMQGKYPVIKLNFKDIESESWAAAFNKFTTIISQEFNRHRYLVTGNITDSDKKAFEKIVNSTGLQEDYESSLALLAKLLHNHHKQRVMFILDEYDVPIHASYLYRYYQDIIRFIKPLLSSILKSNDSLERGFITGAMHIAKAGIFTGLNNFIVFSITNNTLADKFGFTEQEVVKILADFNLSQHHANIKKWYNGYHMGNGPSGALIYNPWSIVNCIQKKGEILSYWVNTSENILLRKVLGSADTETKSELEHLLKNDIVPQDIDESLVVPMLDDQASAAWALLLFTGYLTYTKIEGEGSPRKFYLTIPNQEVRGLYLSLLKSIFSSAIKGRLVNILFQAMREENCEVVQELVESFVRNSMSFFDIEEVEPERSYHLFVLGMLATLNETHEVKSNRESGIGRYDVMIIPRKDTSQKAFIIEFKVTRLAKKLRAAAAEAIDQIRSMDYIQELENRGFKDILLYGMSFYKKQVFVVSAPAYLKVARKKVASKKKSITKKKVTKKRGTS